MDEDTEQASGDAVPLALLADLQAGLLDDATAARVRRLARSDPAVAGRLAALDRVRREVAALGADASSAPEVPADVTARVLRALPRPSDRTAGTAGLRLALYTPTTKGGHD